MKFRRIAAAALVIAFAAPLCANAAEFEDIKGHWAEDAIVRLAEKEIVSGVSETKFDPDEIVTRAEFLRMIMMATNIRVSEYRTGECLDVPENAWYAEYVQGALDRGLIPSEMIEDYEVDIVVSDGEPIAVYNGKFNPETAIMREEIAVLSQTAYQYWTNVDTLQGTDRSDTVDFMDLAKVSTWALPYVRMAFAQGFISGTGDGNFRPRAMATRAQAAVVINNVLEKIN